VAYPDFLHPRRLPHPRLETRSLLFHRDVDDPAFTKVKKSQNAFTEKVLSQIGRSEILLLLMYLKSSNNTLPLTH
jgi:hypothetical protein